MYRYNTRNITTHNKYVEYYTIIYYNIILE